MRAAATGIDIEHDEVDLERSNAKLDLFSSDASALASYAYSRGDPWFIPADLAKRLEFWQWWLTEAVPQAWASVQE